jgi:hypothetical protein
MSKVINMMLLLIATLAYAETKPALATVLTTEGAVMEGASGSFDPVGFRITNSFTGEPLSVDEEFIPSEPVPFHETPCMEGSWYALGEGMGGPDTQVYAIEIIGSDVYAGGDFTLAGGFPANRIARWDGSAWYDVGSGVNSSVLAMDQSDSGGILYVGGSFTQAGGISANRIARWDGSSWSALGSGLNGDVAAVAISGPNVYVGGAFTQAGGISASNIARWDGSSWSALGSGVNGNVLTIAVNGSDVYVGGSFTVAGGIAASRIARWDGSSWSALGTGVNGWIGAIDVCDTGVLYAGGYFTVAGGISANHIARWDGSSWAALGSGVGGEGDYVLAITIDGTDVYVGGFFGWIAGVWFGYIACWDGSWLTLGSGVNSEVDAIATSGSDVYAGGFLTQAGGNPAWKIARWEEDPTGTMSSMTEAVPNVNIILHASPNPMTTGTSFSFQSTSVSPLSLSIYDTSGRLVRTETLGAIPIGSHTHYWDGSDRYGSPLASGVYLVRLSSVEQQASTRVVIVR